MNGLTVGQTARTRRIFTAADISSYRALTGDAGLKFGSGRPAVKRAMVPGPLLGGLFSDLLGTQLPGRGTNWLKQRFAFPKPAYLDELLTAEVEIIRLRPGKALVNLRTIIKDPAGEIVCEGEALVLVADLQSSPPVQ
jgi:acyl dehydratase